jgi:hypothetical protein
MNKEEFHAGISETLEALKDPDNEVHEILTEGRKLAADLEPFDLVLSMKVDNIVTAIQDLFDYVKLRGEIG